MLEAFIQNVMNEQCMQRIFFLCFHVFDHIPSAIFVRGILTLVTGIGTILKLVLNFQHISLLWCRSVEDGGNADRGVNINIADALLLSSGAPICSLDKAQYFPSQCVVRVNEESEIPEQCMIKPNDIFQ